MKSIGAALNVSPLDDALEALARSRRAREAAGECAAPGPLAEPEPQARAPEPSSDPKPKARRSRASGTPGGSLRSAVASVARAREERLREEARTLERSMIRAGYSREEASKASGALLAQVPKPATWLFVMLSPAQNRSVVRFLAHNTRRPLIAHDLWALLLEVIRMDTGEVMRSREELAEAVGCSPDDVSRIMAKLAAIQAVRVERRGRGVRYFVNSNIATHLPGEELRAKARQADGPLLIVVEGGKPSENWHGRSR